jgi:hypothetical protein
MRHLIGILLILTVCSKAVISQTTQPAAGVDLNTGASYPIAAQTTPPPKEWIDKDTGHRVVRLSDEPGSTSLYFRRFWRVVQRNSRRETPERMSA